MDLKRLAQVLVEEGLVTDDQLAAAARDMKEKPGTSLVQTLVARKVIEEDTLAHFLAHQYSTEVEDLSGYKASPGARQMLPEWFARRFRLIPVSFDKTRLRLAAEHPGEVDVSELRRTVRLPAEIAVELRVARATQLTAALEALYPPGSSPQNGGGQIARVQPAGGGDISVIQEAAIAELGNPQPDMTETLDPNALIAEMEEQVEVATDGGGAEEFSVDAANEAPVKRMCNWIIAEASKRGVSDIHINPTERGIVLRYRIDGVLQVMPSPPAAMKKGVIARFKVMANMNITERRKPQDGRIKIKVYDKTIDLRVSVIPQVDGENIVMRILDQSSLQLDLKKLGLEPEELELYHECIRSPYGMVLHTGPTGSGKTTTLYSALAAIYDPKKSIITLEDPVEYEMPGVIQVQMDHEVGLDFATALRSALRQDPNIMMVGEIRNKETARIAVQAALTGHLLFSTLHTNDAPSTIARLIDIGIEPAYVGTAVRLIVAQRLMRRNCKDCATAYTPTEEDLLKIEVPAEMAEGGTFKKGAGCPKCNMTGYKGRVGIYEMLRNTHEVADQIFANADTNAIRRVAEEQGMRSLRTLAIEKWKSGLTSVDEVQRVTMGGD